MHENPERLEKIKKEFSVLIRELTPVEIGQVEQELVEEGMPAESIQLLCDVHLDIFKQALVDDEIEVEPWHPLHILVEEHRAILNKSKELKETIDNMTNGSRKPLIKEIGKLMALVAFFEDVDKYFHKEENSLFTYLEKHGLV